MKNRAIIPIAMLLALPLFPAAALGEMKMMDDKATVASSAALGYEYTHSAGPRPSQFEAYRSVEKGFIFEDLRLLGEWNDPKKPYYLLFEGRDLGQDDQNLYLEMGEYGSHKVSFRWEEFPRLYSKGSPLIQTYQGEGSYTMLDSTQTSLQVDPPSAGGTFTVFDPSNATPLRNNLLQVIRNAPSTDLRVDRQRGTLEYLHKLYPGLNMRVNYTHDFKEGTKLTSVGAYQRPTFNAGALPTASGEGGERWRVTVNEVPEIIDYDSDLLTVGFELARDTWNAALSYNFQQFSNNVDVLTWDNPFNLTNRTAAADANLRGISSARFVQDLAPDSTSHSGTLTGGWDLPFLNTRLTGTVTVGGTWQDDSFLPFSDNGAINTGLPAPLNNPTNPALLPRDSLDGKVLNIVQNYMFTMRPLDPLTVTGKYRYYYYDNKTDRMTLPGYAELIDSQWHSAALNGPRTPGYLKQNADLEFEYALAAMLSARADYGWERWRRWERNVEVTDEHRVGGGVTVKPANWAKMMLDYHWSNRDGGEYTPTTFGTEEENPTSRMYDQSDRSRHAADARFMVTPFERLDFALMGSFFHDDFNTDRLGLRNASTWVAGTDVSYSPLDFLTVMANYTYEDSRARLHGASKTTAVGGTVVGTPNFTDPNLYYTKMKDRAHNFGIGVTGTAVPGRLEFGTYYNYTRGKGRLATYNPNLRDAAQTINSSQALPYADTKTVNHEVRAELTYRFMKRFALNLRYVYENFEVRDFAWDNMASRIDQVVQDGVVVDDTQRVVFLNSKFTDYDAHVGSVTLSYSF